MSELNLTALKVGTVLVHGDFQFPERTGLQFLGCWTEEGDKCYVAPSVVNLGGYQAAQCGCGDLSIPAGTFLKRRSYGGPFSFSSFQVIGDPRPND